MNLVGLIAHLVEYCTGQQWSWHGLESCLSLLVCASQVGNTLKYFVPMGFESPSSPNSPFPLFSATILALTLNQCQWVSVYREPWKQIFILLLVFFNWVLTTVRSTGLGFRLYLQSDSTRWVCHIQNLCVNKLTILFSLWSCAASGTLRVLNKVGKH